MLLAVLVFCLNYARIMPVLKNMLVFLNYASRKYATKAKKSTYFVRGVTRALIGGGGCIFIYSCSARRIFF